MKHRLIWILALGFFAATGGYADHLADAASTDIHVGMIDPRTVPLVAAPIREDWILEGHPKASSVEVAHSHDGSTRVYVWRTSAGRFNWFYDFDEIVTVLDGEMFLVDGANADRSRPERRLGPGDVVFFPKGATVTWRVPDHVRKIATIRHPPPGPIASLIRWGRTVKRWVSPQSAEAAL